jgi:hypothetical protein
MENIIKKQVLDLRPSVKLKEAEEQDDFGLELQSFDDFDFSLSNSKKNFIANESSVHVISLEPPPHLVRRAMRELQNQTMDELLIHRLIGLDRSSAEFQKEYVRLRVKSLMRPRASFSPCEDLLANDWPKTRTFTSMPYEQMVPQEPTLKSPWTVNTLGDLWSFFGPWLTLVIALQLYYSFKLGTLFGSQEMLDGYSPINIGAFIIALASLFTSMFVLKGCKGQEYKNFIPRLSGIGIVSVLIAMASHLMLEFF